MKIAQLQIITQHIEGFSHLAQIEALKNTSANCIQLRVKDKEQHEWFEIGRKAKAILQNTDTQLIINDNVYLAKEIDADGVHLGKKDMMIKEAREILGAEKIIGGTANTFDKIIELYEAGADYIGLGPYRNTFTKKELAPVIQHFGYEVIMKKLVLQKIKIPVIAVGGITVKDVVPLMVAGLHGVAVSSAIVNAKNTNMALINFQNEINKFAFIQ